MDGLIDILKALKRRCDASTPHLHKCDDCSTIWEHLTPPDGCSRELFNKAHSCPKCGKGQRWKYDLKAGEKVDFPWTGSWQ